MLVDPTNTSEFFGCPLPSIKTSVTRCDRVPYVLSVYVRVNIQRYEFSWIDISYRPWDFYMYDDGIKLFCLLCCSIISSVKYIPKAEHTQGNEEDTHIRYQLLFSFLVDILCQAYVCIFFVTLLCVLLLVDILCVYLLRNPVCVLLSVYSGHEQGRRPPHHDHLSR